MKDMDSLHTLWEAFGPKIQSMTSQYYKHNQMAFTCTILLIKDDFVYKQIGLLSIWGSFLPSRLPQRNFGMLSFRD